MTSKAGYKIGKDEEGLTARQRAVLALLKGGMNQNGIASQLNMTRQRVSQIKGELIAKGKYTAPPKDEATNGASA